MGFTVRPAGPSDIESVFRIRVDALKPDIWTQIVYPNGRSTETINRGMESWRADLDNKQQPLFVAVDDANDEVVAFAKWTLLEEPQCEAEWKQPYVSSSAGKEANDEAFRVIDKAKYDLNFKYIKGSPHVYLNYLCVDPAHQGKGLGGLLMKWGTDAADKRRLPCFLDSTFAGHNLYLRRGFEDIDAVEIDATPFGVKQMARLDFMHRLPK